jgi:DNA-binding beta-propeller fold protein YncE
VRKVFVSDEYGRQEIVIDAATSSAQRSIPLGGEAGNTQYDSGSGRIWVAVQTRNQLVAIDPATDSVVARVAVPGVDRPHGFVIDPVHRLAYVAGEGSGRLGVLDLRTNRVLATYSVGDEPDVLAMDPGRHRLFVAAESGVVTAFDIRDRSLSPLPSYRAPHAHSVAVDPESHLIYLPLESVGGRPVLRILRLENP